MQFFLKGISSYALWYFSLLLLLALINVKLVAIQRKSVEQSYSLIRDFPIYCGNYMFITAFTSSCHLTLQNQINLLCILPPILYSIYLTSCVILRSVCDSSNWGFFPSGLIIEKSVLSSLPCVPHAQPLSFLLGHPSDSEEYRLYSSLLWKYSVFSFLFYLALRRKYNILIQLSTM